MSSEPRDSFLRHRALYIFLICVLLFGLGQFHRMSGAVIMPPISADLGVPVASLGIAAAALFFSAAFAQVPLGIALDQFGPRRTMPVVLVLAVGGSFLLAAADSLNDVIVARGLIGAGYSVIMMAAYVLFAKWFPPSKFAMMASWLTASASFGAMMSSAPLAYAIEVVGWRIPVFVVGALTLLMMVIGAIVIRDGPPGYKESADRPATIRQSLKGYWDVLKYPRFFNLLAMGIVAYGPSTALVGMWGGPYLEKTFAMDALGRGHILFLMAAAMPCGALFFGFIDRVGKSRKMIVMCAASTVLGAFLTLALYDGLPVWLAAGLFIYINFTQQYYVVLAAHCRNLFPDHMVGRANSTLNLIAILGIGLLQSLYGWILARFPETGYEISFLAVAGILATTLLIYSRSVEIRS